MPSVPTHLKMHPYQAQSQADRLINMHFMTTEWCTASAQLGLHVWLFIVHTEFEASNVTGTEKGPLNCCLHKRVALCLFLFLWAVISDYRYCVLSSRPTAEDFTYTQIPNVILAQSDALRLRWISVSPQGCLQSLLTFLHFYFHFNVISVQY